MPFVPFNIGRLPYGRDIDPDRLRQMADFLNAMVDVNGDFLLGDITIGRGGGKVYTNAAIGRNALQANTTGQGCFAAGSDALLANTTGSYNTAAGQNALKANVTSQSSSAFGASALVLATGGFNDAFGAITYASMTTGSGNAGFGGGAGLFLTDGSQNCHVGVRAGSTLQDDITSVTSSDQCVFIGWNVHPGSATSTNEIAIGSAAVGEGSNSTVIGNSSTLTAHIYGAVTVGGLVIDDAKNIVLNTTTGTKIGTATSQKLGLWNATPVVQPTTAVTAAAFTANSSGIADDTATFGGYTIGQIVAALKAIGALA